MNLREIFDRGTKACAASERPDHAEIVAAFAPLAQAMTFMSISGFRVEYMLWHEDQGQEFFSITFGFVKLGLRCSLLKVPASILDACNPVREGRIWAMTKNVARAKAKLEEAELNAFEWRQRYEIQQSLLREAQEYPIFG